MRLVLLAAVTGWIGVALLLSRLRWFARQPLVERIRPYTPGGLTRPSPGGWVSFATFAEVAGPLATSVGERLSRVFGVRDQLGLRLRRIHSPVDPTAFRVRQLTWSIAGLGGGALVAASVRPPAPLAALLVAGTPLLVFLLLEQQVSRAASAWQRRTFLELPVVAEQIGMLLSAGYSLGSALNRISNRSDGACARDLARVGHRIRQGLGEIDALREWAEVVEVDAATRLVQVLSLNREASDLGRLIGAEARSIRRDAQRELVERIERRAQQVWIPVTVAALVPGVIFLAVPFIEALRLFGAR